VSIRALAVRRACRAQVTHATVADLAEPKTRKKGASAMNTLLIASQIVCYGVGIVSASLNIAVFVRRRHARSRRRL
jgi:hypothetical protein